MPPTLPPEIRDMIIDEFSIRGHDGDWPHRDLNNRRVLRTLLFVSQDVAIRARHHLFERVDLSLITRCSCLEAAKHKKQLSLLADIITSSATSRSLGILPHIRRIFIFCHGRIANRNFESEEGSEEDVDSDDSESQYVEQEAVSFNESQYNGILCDILNVVRQKACRIDEFHITANETTWDSIPRTFDALEYEDWEVQFPDNVKRAIFDLIHSPRFIIETVSLIQFSDVPVNVLMGTHVKRAILHARPSHPTPSLDPDIDPEEKDTLPAPPIFQLQTLDYILGDVTQFIRSQSKSSTTSVKKLSLDVPMSWIRFAVDADRFEELGNVITEFYTSIYHLNLTFQAVYTEELEDGNFVFDVSEWTMAIDIRTLPNLTHLSIQHNYAWGAFRGAWYISDHDVSGPGLQNVIAILKYCPDTLVSIHWEMGFPLNRVVGDDLKCKMVKDYSELDKLLTTKFPSLCDFTIWCCVKPKDPAFEEGCCSRIRQALPHLADRLDFGIRFY